MSTARCFGLCAELLLSLLGPLLWSELGSCSLFDRDANSLYRYVSAGSLVYDLPVMQGKAELLQTKPADSPGFLELLVLPARLLLRFLRV